LNIWKRLLGLLLFVCLMMTIVPMAHASETDEDIRNGLDYSELELQVAMANGLNDYEYTKESWKRLQEALEVGRTRLDGIYNQGKLDSAAEDIANALSALVKIDFSLLQNALDAVNAKVNTNAELHDVWYRIDKATDKAKQLLISGDQEAIDAVAAELEGLLEELAACAPVKEDPEVIIKEVEVEVLPTSDFCNIPIHHTWPTLFGISVLLNVVLIALLVFVIARKRKTTDNTPLVNYDIDDDVDF